MRCILNGNPIPNNLSHHRLTFVTPTPKNPQLKVSYEKAKELDKLAESTKSNERLIEAIQIYENLILNHDKQLNDTILKEIGVRCIERMRFLGKLKAAIEIHRKLIERFPDEVSFQSQLAVTYLLGNR